MKIGKLKTFLLAGPGLLGLASGVCAKATRHEPPVPAYFEKVGSHDDFSLLAGPSFYGPNLNLPQVLFVIDRAQGDRSYYINSKRYKLHMDFLNDQYFTLERGYTFIDNNISTNRRRFVSGFIVWRKREGTFTLELWDDDAMSPEMFSLLYSVVKRTFFAPVLFKPNSTYQDETLAAGAPDVPKVREKFVPRTLDYQALNSGVAIGKMRLAARKAGGDAGGNDDIVIFHQLPKFLPALSGFIMKELTTELSHLCILARSMGIPGAFIRRADESHKNLEGKDVYLEVRPDGYELRLASRAEVRGFKERRRSRAGKIRLPSDLGYHDGLTDLRQQRGADVIRFGAKSANLGEMMNSDLDGLLIPRGFTVSFYYYAEFVRENRLTDVIHDFLQDRRVSRDPVWRKKRLARLRDTIRNGNLNDRFKSLVLNKVESEYKGVGVFVRSSTNAEDLPNFTGAGLYTTVPNVVGGEAVLEAIKVVWASVWNERAFLARESFGIDHASVLPAVLIQKGVNADNAGVLLTVNPRNPSDKGAVYIAAKKGLGIRVVEGYQLPEQILYYPNEDRVRVLNLSRDDTMLTFSPSGGVQPEAVMPGEPVLSNDIVRRLGRIALGIQEIFGGGATGYRVVDQRGEGLYCSGSTLSNLKFSILAATLKGNPEVRKWPKNCYSTILPYVWQGIFQNGHSGFSRFSIIYHYPGDG